jgi:CRP/FNR family nitrogen fixation transcriptional regulator
MPDSLFLYADTGFAAVRAAPSYLSAATPARLASVSQPALHYSADCGIYAEGDAALTFYRIVSGMVRTCNFMADGRRQIDAFHAAGDVFGFEAGATYGMCAEAVSGCTVIPYRRRNLEGSMAREDTVPLQLFSHAMACLERARAHALLLGRGSAVQKLSRFLLEMTLGKPEAEVIELAMTRQDIADYLGLTIETVSRTLSQFERGGMISRAAARRVHLTDRAALLALGI